jgi:uncharacterized protein YraI
MNNQNQKSQFTPLTYILIGVAIILAYLLFASNSSPNDCKVGDYLQVRAGPGLNYDVMLVLSEGDRLTLNGVKSNDWLEVQTATGVQGWVWERVLVCR